LDYPDSPALVEFNVGPGWIVQTALPWFSSMWGPSWAWLHPLWSKHERQSTIDVLKHSRNMLVEVEEPASTGSSLLLTEQTPRTNSSKSMVKL
jgi:hypothetical protein